MSRQVSRTVAPQASTRRGEAAQYRSCAVPALRLDGEGVHECEPPRSSLENEVGKGGRRSVKMDDQILAPFDIDEDLVAADSDLFAADI